MEKGDDKVPLYGPGKHTYFVRAKDVTSLDNAMVMLKIKSFTMECRKSSQVVCVWHIKEHRREAEETLRTMQNEGVIESYAEDKVPAMHI